MPRIRLNLEIGLELGLVGSVGSGLGLVQLGRVGLGLRQMLMLRLEFNDEKQCRTVVLGKFFGIPLCSEFGA